MKIKTILAAVCVTVLIISSYSSCMSPGNLESEEAAVPPETPSVLLSALPDPAEAHQAAAEWTMTARQWRGQAGMQVSLDFPPEGSPGAAWGTDTYTDNSSIGTAAVHAGLISFESGGTITIEIIGGQDSYTGTERNNISTASFGNWGGSFVFPAAATEKNEPAPIELFWSDTAQPWRTRTGERMTFLLPPGGLAGTIWGTDIYTDDSSIGTAAVHAGLISLESGGKVTIKLLGGQDAYTGSERNGIQSRSYGRWRASFSFVTD